MELQKLKIHLMTLGYSETYNSTIVEIWKDSRGDKSEITIYLSRENIIWYIYYNNKYFHFVGDFFEFITTEKQNDNT